MDLRYTRKLTVLPSQLDPGGKLSVPATFDLFMDTATEAAEAMGLGWAFLMKKGLFWITVKTKIRFLDRPGILDEVEIVTWPKAPDEKRCDRHYELRRDGRPLIQAKTEWAIVSVLTKRPQAMDKVMPADTPWPEEVACADPFPIIDGDFADPPFAEHRVASTDIDMARHMNNVAYVRAIVGAFSVKAWQKLDVRQMDVIFLSPAHEGDTIRFQKCERRGGMDLRGSLPDGRTVVLARLETGGR